MYFMTSSARTLIKTSFLFFAYQCVLRGVFAVAFANTASEFKTSDLFKALYLGLKFDMRMALFITLPLALLIVFLPPSKKSVKKRWVQLYTFAFFTITLIHFLDFGFYSYLNSRVSSTALQFLKNPLISAQMLWESYPIIWVFVASLFLTAIAHRTLTRWALNSPYQLTHPYAKKTSVIFCLLLFTFGIYGKFSKYPLRWSEAFFSNNSFITALALNPTHYFIDTISVSKKAYDKKIVTAHYAEVSDYLGVLDKNKSRLLFSRPIIKTPLNGKKPNIVVIVLESFAAYKTGVMNNPLNPTPLFDALAKKGVLFTNYYVPSEGTARSMFGLVSGVPDVTSYRTSSRNPLITKQNSAAKALLGYNKLYFLGGSANWGEIRGVIASSIPGIQIFEEGDFESPITDVWGISDYHLFEEAHKSLNKLNLDKPFFALIQSAGFHRPYTIPENIPGFKTETIDNQKLTQYGFVSNDEFNSLRFQDYSLGHFFELNKNSKYFENTIFIITGDHGLPDENAEHIPKGYNLHDLSRFHVPLLFYSPEHFKPQINLKIATEPDVLVTALGLTGFEYTNKAMGRNLFAKNYERSAFMFVYHTVPKQIGMLHDQFYALGNTQSGVTDLYLYKSDTPMKDVKGEHPQVYKKLKALTEGFYETSRYMLYNNN